MSRSRYFLYVLPVFLIAVFSFLMSWMLISDARFLESLDPKGITDLARIEVNKTASFVLFIVAQLGFMVFLTFSFLRPILQGYADRIRRLEEELERLRPRDRSNREQAGYFAAPDGGNRP
jgi:hypothetical protein